jgi:hypothetical protein
MALTAPPAASAAPGTAPSRSDRTTFASRADAAWTWLFSTFWAWTGSFVTWYTGTAKPELEALQADVAAKQSSAAASATTALNAINVAGTSATTTAIKASAGGANTTIAAVVAAGTLYCTVQAGKALLPGHMLCCAATDGSANYIGIRVVSYDNATGALVGAVLYSEGAGTFAAWTLTFMTDPTKLVPRLTHYVTSGDYACLAGAVYIVTGAHNGTLPASPSAGDFVSFKNRSGLATVQVLRNGALIEALAEDLTIDSPTGVFTLSYTGTTYGWEVV